MGFLINKLDSAITGSENKTVTNEELAALIQPVYITGKSKEQLKTLRKWVKGGFFSSLGGRHRSEDQDWILCVAMEYGIFDVLLGTKIVWLHSNSQRRTYRIPDRKGREFKKLIHLLIQQELIRQAQNNSR